MSAAHTPGKLEEFNGFLLRICEVGTCSQVAEISAPYRKGVGLIKAHHESAANLRRLSACWNACNGISTEALEQLEISDSQVATAARILNVQLLCQRDDLLEALETLCNGLEWNIENHPTIMNEADNEALAGARAVIAKATGSAA